MASSARPWMWTRGTVQAFITGPGSAFVGVTTPRYHRDDPVVNDRDKKCLDLAVKMLNDDWVRGIRDTDEKTVKMAWRKADQKIPWVSEEMYTTHWLDMEIRNGKPHYPNSKHGSDDRESRLVDRVSKRILSIDKAKLAADDILRAFIEAVSDPSSADSWWVAEGEVTQLEPLAVRVKSLAGGTKGEDWGYHVSETGVTNLLRGKWFRTNVNVGFFGPRQRMPRDVGESVEGYPAYDNDSSVYSVRVVYPVRVRILGARQDKEGIVYITSEIRG